MGCVGLIRIICRISRTLFPPNHITKTDRKCQQNRIPPYPSPAHIFTSIMMIIPLPRNFFSFPSRTVFRSPAPAGPPPDGPAFCLCINTLCPQLWGGGLAAPSRRIAPRPAAPRRCPRCPPRRDPRGATPTPATPSSLRGLGEGTPPGPAHTHTHTHGQQEEKAQQVRNGQDGAGASKRFPNRSFWLNRLGGLRNVCFDRFFSTYKLTPSCAICSCLFQLLRCLS